MSEFNIKAILNNNDDKVLKRSFEKLRDNYSKDEAHAYSKLYLNKPLSFIVDNARYIFTEPAYGLPFFNKIVSNNLIPFNRILELDLIICGYVERYVNEMPDEDANAFKVFKNKFYENVYIPVRNIIGLYGSIMTNTTGVDELYDAAFEFKEKCTEDALTKLNSFLSDVNEFNLIDAINIGLDIPAIQGKLFEYIKSAYTDDPKDKDDYLMNTTTINILSRLVQNTFFKDRIDRCGNINLKHLIFDLAFRNTMFHINKLNDQVESLDDNTGYKSANDALYSMVSAEENDEIFESFHAEQKLFKLMCECAVVDTDLAFAVIDESTMYNEGNYKNLIMESYSNKMSNDFAIENTFNRILMLDGVSKKINTEIELLTEKYFAKDGSPSNIVGNSSGYKGDKLENDEDKPKRKKKAYKDDDDNLDFSDLEDDSYVHSKSSVKRDKKFKPEKPKSPGFFRGVQNAAMKADMKFKKFLGKGKKTHKEAIGAGKAIAKIPKGIEGYIKKTVDEWDEADDNRRKKYIIEPGFRKKYFKALKLGILHFGAFNINPLLNIVLLISHKVSQDKDVRIRNELIRELKAEVKVLEEKIEDAKQDGNNKAKYKLMRYKEKIDAEIVRVTANSEFV